MVSLEVWKTSSENQLSSVCVDVWVKDRLVSPLLYSPLKIWCLSHSSVTLPEHNRPFSIHQDQTRILGSSNLASWMGWSSTKKRRKQCIQFETGINSILADSNSSASRLHFNTTVLSADQLQRTCPASRWDGLLPERQWFESEEEELRLTAWQAVNF